MQGGKIGAAPSATLAAWALARVAQVRSEFAIVVLMLYHARSREQGVDGFAHFAICVEASRPLAICSGCPLASNTMMRYQHAYDQSLGPETIPPRSATLGVGSRAWAGACCSNTCRSWSQGPCQAEQRIEEREPNPFGRAPFAWLSSVVEHTRSGGMSCRRLRGLTSALATLMCLLRRSQSMPLQHKGAERRPCPRSRRSLRRNLSVIAGHGVRWPVQLCADPLP